MLHALLIIILLPIAGGVVFWILGAIVGGAAAVFDSGPREPRTPEQIRDLRELFQNTLFGIAVITVVVLLLVYAPHASPA